MDHVVKVDPTQPDRWKHVVTTVSKELVGTAPLYGHTVKLTNGLWRHYYCSRYFAFQFFPLNDELDHENQCLFCLGAEYNRPIEEICRVVDDLMKNKGLKCTQREIVEVWKNRRNRNVLCKKYR